MRAGQLPLICLLALGLGQTGAAAEPAIPENVLQTWSDAQLLAAIPRHKHKPARQAPASGYTPGDKQYGPTQAGEDLWLIAQRLAPERGVSAEQMFVELYQNNPKAFRQHNPLHLKSGVRLHIPDPAPLASAPPNLSREAEQQAAIEQLQHKIDSLEQQRQQPPATSQPETPSPISTPAAATPETHFAMHHAPWLAAALLPSVLLAVWLRRQRKSSAASTTARNAAEDEITDPANRDDFGYSFDPTHIKPPTSINDELEQIESEDDYDDLTDQDPNETKLDLIKAYLDMGEPTLAQELAEQVITEGNPEQQAQARNLLNKNY